MISNVLDESIRSSHPDVFLEKGVLKICSKFTGEHPCQSAISIKLQTTLLKSHFDMGCKAILLKSHFGKVVLPYI